MLREVLRHQSVEHVTQVEIDQAVIDMCKQYLPNHSAGAFDDPRANIVIADGVEFVNACAETFDVIISDCTDPVGPGEVLFSSRFYEGCKRCLTPGGVFVAQNGVAFMQPDELVTTRRRLGPYFATRAFTTRRCRPMSAGSWPLPGPVTMPSCVSWMWPPFMSASSAVASRRAITTLRCMWRALRCRSM